MLLIKNLHREEVHLTSSSSQKNIEIFSAVDGQSVSLAISNLCLVSEFLRKIINSSMDCFVVWSDLAIILPFPVSIIEKLKQLLETGECNCAAESQTLMKEALSLMRVKADWIIDCFNPQLPPHGVEDQHKNELKIMSINVLDSQHKLRTDKISTRCPRLLVEYERVIESDSELQTRDGKNRGRHWRNGNEVLSQVFNPIETTPIKVTSREQVDGNVEEASLDNYKMQPELWVQDIVYELVSNSIECRYGGITPFQSSCSHLPDSNPLEIASAAVSDIHMDVHQEEVHVDDVSNHTCWIQDIAYNLLSNVFAPKVGSQTLLMTRRQKRIFHLENLKSRMSLKYKLSLEISPEVKVFVKRISEEEILKNTAKSKESVFKCNKTKAKGGGRIRIVSPGLFFVRETVVKKENGTYDVFVKCLLCEKICNQKVCGAHLKRKHSRR